MVMFNSSTYSGVEADGIIPVTVVATGTASIPYTIIIAPSESDQRSIREVEDLSTDTIEVTFSPGETNKTIHYIANQMYLSRVSELFLSLSPGMTTLGIFLGAPSKAVAKIADINSKWALYF